MTEDDIFRLVRQADGILVRSGFFPAHCVMLNDQLIRFAALVVAAEREACARAASIALLGADKSLSDRVLNAVRERSK